jgi:biotin carboxyl carrier protein
MVRLPDIPVESWIADQQDRLNRLTSGAFPSLEFNAAALDAESNIPAYGAEEEFASEEERRLAEEEERRRQQQLIEQQRAAEEQRQQQEAMAAQQRQQQMAQQQSQAEQAEAARQQGLADQAWQMARDIGIPTPGDVYDYFTGANARPPGVGDHASSAGTFDSEPEALGGFGEQTSGLPYADPTTISSSDDFMAATGSLNDSLFGPPDTGPEYGPELPSDTPVFDTLTGAGRSVLEGAERVTRATPAGSAVWDIGETAAGVAGAAIDTGVAALEQAPRIIGAVGRGARKTYEESDDPGVESLIQTPEQTERIASVQEATPVGRAIKAAQDLGQSIVLEGATNITGELWREYGAPMVYIGADGPYVSQTPKNPDDVEINPGEFFLPDRLAGGGMRSVGRLATKAPYGTFIAGAVERGTGRAIGAVGSRLGQGIRAVAEEIGDTATAAREGLAEGLVGAGRAADTAVRGVRSLFTGEGDAPEAARSLPAYRIGTKTPEGRRRMFHGTAGGWTTPDETRFDEDGLFGPGYYLTSDPRVAGEYAQGASNIGDDVIAEIGEDGFLQPIGEPRGANIRPVDLDATMQFFHADRYVPQQDLRRIVRALEDAVPREDPELGRSLQEYRALLSMDRQQYLNYARRPDSVLHGETFYKNLGRDFLSAEDVERRYQIEAFGDEDGDIKPDKRFVNEILSRAGFDGIYYDGGSRIPTRDAAGNLIRHQAVAVFPDKLPKIRNALSGEARGNRPAPQKVWEVFDPATGDLIDSFDNEVDARLRSEELTRTSGKMFDYSEASNEPPAPIQNPADIARQMRQNIGADRFSRDVEGMLPTQGITGSAIGSVTGSGTGAVAGWNSADEDAPLSEKLDRATRGFTAGAMVGAAGGAGAAVAANIAGKKLVSEAIRSGRMSLDVMGTHPGMETRIKALMLLEARDIPDDAPVPVSDYAQYFTLGQNLLEVDDVLRRTGLGRWNPQTGAVEFNELTAGQIRERFKNTRAQDLGKAASGLVVDALRGQSLRHIRGREARADIASVTGEFPKTPDVEWSNYHPGEALPIGEGRYAHEIFSDDDTMPTKWRSRLEAIYETADQLKVPVPRVFVEKNTDLNASGYRHTGGQPIVTITTGLLDSEATDDAVMAVFAHEFAHVTDADRGRSLLEPTEKFVGRVAQKVRDDVIPAVRRRFERTADDQPLDEIEVGRPDFDPGDIPEAEYHRLPSGQPTRGIWKERLDAGPQFPEGVRPNMVREIERNFNEVKRIIARMQDKWGTKNQMRFHTMAEQAWAKYEATVARAGSTVPQSTRTGVEGAVPPPRTRGPGRPRPAGPSPETDLGVDTAPDVGPTRTPDIVDDVAETPPASTADEMVFEPEELPDVLDPKRQFTQDQFADIVRQAKQESAADTATVRLIEQGAGKLADRKTISGKNVASFLEAIGQRRYVQRRDGTPANWADKFLRQNGWLAPRDEAVGEAGEEVLGRRGAGAVQGEAAVSPEMEATIPPTGDLSVRRPDEVLDPRTAPGVQNLQGGAAGALVGATDEDPEDEEYEVSIERMATGAVLGILGRRKILPSLQKGAANHPFAGNPTYNSYVNPTPNKAPEAGIFERIATGVTTRWTDDLSRLQQYQKDLQREWQNQMGGPLPTYVLAAELKRLDPLRSAEMFVDTYMKPHLKTFVRLGITDEAINTYIANVHNIDIANQTGNPGRTFPGGASVTDAIASNQKFIAALKQDLTPAQFQEFEQAVDGIWDVGDRVLKLKRDAGLIDAKAYSDMRNAYPHYVPTRIMDYINDDTNVQFGKSLSITSNTIREMGQHGTDKDALMPLPALLGAVYEARVAAQKNQVFQAFISMATHASRLPSTVSGSATGRSQERAAELANSVIALNPSDKAPPGMVAVQGFLNGTKVKFAVDKTMGDVVKFQAPVSIPLLTGLMHAFRAGATARNPAFLTANMFLDLSNYMIRETARAGGPHKMFEVFEVYARTFHEFLSDPNAWKYIASHEYRGDMERFLREGGGSSGQVGRGALRPDPTHIKRLDDLTAAMGFRKQAELEGEIGRLTREGMTPLSARTPAEAIKMLGDLATLRPVEAIGERIELIPRVAAMRMAERRGASQLESVIAGRTTTIDFNKGGAWARTVNQMIPFFNVGMQAIADTGRAYRENPKAWTATVVTMVGAPMIIAESWNQSDPQRRKDYMDVPDYIKDQGLVMMIPNSTFTDEQGNERPNYFHFRYRQLAPVAQMTRRILQDWVPEWRDERPAQEQRAWHEELLAGAAAMSPVAASDETDLITSLTPLGVQTGIQLAMDWDSYRGKRIKSAYADERSSPLSKGLSALSQDTPLEGTAAQWEFGTRDVGTGYAGMLHGASEILAGRGTKSNTPQEIPVAGGLLSRFVKSSIGGNAETARENTLTESSEKLLRQHGITWRPSPADPEIKNVPLLRGEYTTYQRAMNKATDIGIRKAVENPRFVLGSPADKRVILDRIIAAERDKERNRFFATIPAEEKRERLRKLREEGKLATVGSGQRRTRRT